MFRVYLYDLSGKKVLEEVSVRGGQKVNITELPPATYLIRIMNEQGKYYSKKVVKIQ